jgi:esterase/lipase superfamily enzyme
VNREYVRRWSRPLGREMELLRYGHAGQPVVAFPAEDGGHVQWEDFGMVGSLAWRLAAGALQLWCVDSVDRESWAARGRSPEERVERHLEYERYVVDELLPELPGPPVLVGTAFGAFHAVLLCLRYPDRFQGWIALSGEFDSGRWLDGYTSEETYLTNPLTFLPGLSAERAAPLRALRPAIVATGTEDDHVRDSEALVDLLRAKGVDVQFDLWPGWQHDWSYWRRMLDGYL